MTKIFQKTIVLLMLVMVMMTSLAMPAFANGSGSGASCNTSTLDPILNKMYGVENGKYALNDATSEYGYEINVTVGNDVCKVFLAERPDVNSVGAKIENGKLTIFGMGNGDSNTWNQFFARYKGVIVGISGVGAITFIALFIMQFMKLGASAGNPQARSQALTGCLWTGIAAAALGAVSIIAGFFYNAI